MPMRVIEIRQALHDMDDDDIVGFLSDNGEEFHIGGAVHLPEYDILYFGETQPGLEEALQEIEALMDDDEERIEQALDGDSEACALEGSDLGVRCEIGPEKDGHHDPATEEL